MLYLVHVYLHVAWTKSGSQVKRTFLYYNNICVVSIVGSPGEDVSESAFTLAR